MLPLPPRGSSPYQGEVGRGYPSFPGLAPSAHSAYMRATNSNRKLQKMAEYADPENTLVIETTKGNVVIAMRPDLAPNHVAHIKKLAREGFYDGIVFHRVIDGFMAQTGCPQGRGTGGSKYPDLKQEFNAEPHVRGTASMARAQNPDSANSQFFICFGDAPFLNKQYTVWGQVIEGMDNVDQIKRGEPVINPDKMLSVKVAADIAA
jgi:peptidylprolyl isomerase